MTRNIFRYLLPVNTIIGRERKNITRKILNTHADAWPLTGRISIRDDLKRFVSSEASSVM
jgi:hypothetical protein